MLERARRLAIAEQLDNVTYEHGDAQVHRFAPGHYDLAISRFGAMFFSDPVAAFSNIARALRVSGRLVLLVWQSRERNEWATAIDAALNGPAPPLVPATTADPFSLGERAATARVLERAGLRGIRFSGVREPVIYGHDTAAAMDLVCSFQSTRETLASLTPANTARALQRLRDTLDDHRTAHDGIVFDSRAWMITAHRG
jgi:SAM-dependent methyltransferase